MMNNMIQNMIGLKRN